MCLGPTRVPALSGTLVCNCGVFFDRSPFARASLSANALAGSGARTECMGRLLPGRARRVATDRRARLPLVCRLGVGRKLR